MLITPTKTPFIVMGWQRTATQDPKHKKVLSRQSLLADVSQKKNKRESQCRLHLNFSIFLFSLEIVVKHLESQTNAKGIKCIIKLWKFVHKSHKGNGKKGEDDVIVCKNVSFEVITRDTYRHSTCM
jgi:hypothetical protein